MVIKLKTITINVDLN